MLGIIPPIVALALNNCRLGDWMVVLTVSFFLIMFCAYMVSRKR